MRVDCWIGDYATSEVIYSFVLKEIKSTMSVTLSLAGRASRSVF